MSSSDDDWGRITTKPPAVAGSGDESDMMALRSRALQQQREERMRRAAEATKQRTGASPPRQPHGASHSQSPAPTGPVESSLPLDLFGEFSSESEARTASVADTAMNHYSKAGSAGARPSKVSSETTLGSVEASASRQAAPTPAALLEESVSALRQKVTSKKKVLQSLREKEMALLEKYRKEKAHKKSEIVQIEEALRSVWSQVEDEKRSLDSKIRDTSDEHERLMLSTRRQVESEIRQKYEPDIKSLQEELEAMQSEEKKLKDLLSLEDGTKDLIESAVAAATNGIIERMQTIFQENAKDTQEWNKEVEQLVQHEVKSSFTVSAGSESQSEREEMRKHFEDMLSLWKQVEEEERERVLKMDDALLSDIQKMAHEDITRLQAEELHMEQVYARSRESWAEQHQKLLDAEQEAAFRRRELEFNDQRQRQSRLHGERMAFIEEHHKEKMKLEEHRHAQEMKMLRDHFQREEQLAEEQHRTLLATQQEVKNATQSLDTVLQSIEDVASSLKQFHERVEADRAGVEEERVKVLQERESSLQSLMELLSSQRVNMESQHQQLATTISEISSLGAQVKDHLQEEEMWLTQQEAKYTASREEWEREHRRWKQLVEQERLSTEEQFSEALSALQDCLGLMNSEEKEVAVEMNAMRSAFSDIANETEKEVSALATRENELELRHESVKEVLNHLQRKSSEASSQYRDLQQQRHRLACERARVRQETARIREMEMAFQLRMKMDASEKNTNVNQEISETRRNPKSSVLDSKSKHQLEHTVKKSGKKQSAVPKTRSDLHHRAHNTSARRCDLEGNAPLVYEGVPHSGSLTPPSYLPAAAVAATSERLPHQVLAELQQQLFSGPLASKSERKLSPSPTVDYEKLADRHTSSSRKIKQAHSKHMDPQPVPATPPPLPQSTNVNHHTNRKPSSATAVEQHRPSSPNTDATSLSADHSHESTTNNTFTNLITISDNSNTSA